MALGVITIQNQLLLLLLLLYSTTYHAYVVKVVPPAPWNHRCYRKHTSQQLSRTNKITDDISSSNNMIWTLRSSNYNDVQRMNDQNSYNNNNNNDDVDMLNDNPSLLSFCKLHNRRDMMIHSFLLCSGGVATTATIPNVIPLANAIDNNNSEDETAVPVLKTSSGLKYIDIVPGTGISPTYGNLCSVSYTAYVKLPNNSKYSTKPQKYDHCDGYLIKHGNGRMIAGLDEGLHTMKVGGTRRLLIPPKLGFVDVGLGPLPDLPWNRYHLNQLLDQMIEVSGGTMIYEVTLLSVIPDEADVGYYTDASLSPQDFNTLRENLRISGNEGRIQEQAEEMAKNTIKGQDRLL